MRTRGCPIVSCSLFLLPIMVEYICQKIAPVQHPGTLPRIFKNLFPLLAAGITDSHLYIWSYMVAIFFQKK